MMKTKLDHNELTGVDLRGLAGKQLLYLGLQENKIHDVDLRPLAGTSLIDLDLLGNEISDIVIEDLAGSGLQILNVEDNLLTELDLTGVDRTALKELWVASNQITTIDFTHLQGALLTTLDLDKNALRKIDFGGLLDDRGIDQTELHSLYLAHNDIEEVNMNLFFEKRIAMYRLDLSYNPVVFDHGGAEYQGCDASELRMTIFKHWTEQGEFRSELIPDSIRSEFRHA